MSELRDYLLQEEKNLAKLIEQAEHFLKKAPRGSLRISRSNDTDQYYWRTDPKDTIGTYIKKGNEKLIQDLAQKEYAQKILITAKEKLDKIKELLDVYKLDKIMTTYSNLPLAKQKVITPYILPDKDYIEFWQQKKYNEKQQLTKQPAFIEKANSVNDDSIIITEKGEIVRSKSEKILADKFKLMNIPYVYELPLYLDGYGYIKPDFTMLNVRTRNVYYWEHLGLMDNAEYCEKAIKKIELFERNGIFPGDQLILTYETEKHPLNMKAVDQLIEHYLL